MRDLATTRPGPWRQAAITMSVITAGIQGQSPCQRPEWFTNFLGSMQPDQSAIAIVVPAASRIEKDRRASLDRQLIALVADLLAEQDGKSEAGFRRLLGDAFVDETLLLRRLCLRRHGFHYADAQELLARQLELLISSLDPRVMACFHLAPMVCVNAEWVRAASGENLMLVSRSGTRIRGVSADLCSKGGFVAAVRALRADGDLGPGRVAGAESEHGRFVRHRVAVLRTGGAAARAVAIEELVDGFWDLRRPIIREFFRSDRPAVREGLGEVIIRGRRARRDGGWVPTTSSTLIPVGAYMGHRRGAPKAVGCGNASAGDEMIRFLPRE